MGVSERDALRGYHKLGRRKPSVARSKGGTVLRTARPQRRREAKVCSRPSQAAPRVRGASTTSLTAVSSGACGVRGTTSTGSSGAICLSWPTTP